MNKILNKAPNIIKHIYALFFILIGWEIFAFDNFTIMKNDFSLPKVIVGKAPKENVAEVKKYKSPLN